MTLIYGQQFIDGIIITADSRASKLNPTGKYDPWKDNTQKIFRIKGHLFVSFCGDIDFAGSIISFLINEVRKNP